ncbi:DUF2586 family protein [Flavobacterium cerinum]|uniref:DUF2586 family protein n=1 Tax=Flavobacterium cerinum TaxID=2502784 RepID=A0A3S3RK43_9FLAO|nr:DUF2586 family protein [Flavobacterium cerinum]RWX00916.1 hypothetical protein EPI11_07800 [Flavobacterium cerinum]
MSLPRVDIQFQNGQSGQLLDTPDGVFGFLASAVTVSTTFLLNTAYQVRGMVDVAALGIVPSTDNYVLYKALKEFYAEAGDGTELWIMGLARTTKVSDWFTPDVTTGTTPAETLLNKVNGKLTMLWTAFSPSGSYTPTIVDAIDGDLWLAMAKAQTLAENYTDQKYAPFYTLFEGYAYTGIKADLKDLLASDYNRCQVIIGDTEKRTGTPVSKGAAIGVLAGRKAKSQVQVNPAKVRDGALSNINAFVLDIPAEEYDITAIHDKGYVTFRTHTTKSGYYFTDDPLACPIADDYHYGTGRRVIDKAYRLAFGVLVEYILDDNTINPDGTISPIYAKGIEDNVISTIFQQMTTAGELSYDPNDPKSKGVICKVDLTNNVRSTSTLKLAQLQVLPKGYNRYIDVPLGFVPITTE